MLPYTPPYCLSRGIVNVGITEKILLELRINREWVIECVSWYWTPHQPSIIHHHEVIIIPDAHFQTALRYCSRDESAFLGRADGQPEINICRNGLAAACWPIKESKSALPPSAAAVFQSKEQVDTSQIHSPSCFTNPFFSSSPPSSASPLKHPSRITRNAHTQMGPS